MLLNEDLFPPRKPSRELTEREKEAERAAVERNWQSHVEQVKAGLTCDFCGYRYDRQGLCNCDRLS